MSKSSSDSQSSSQTYSTQSTTSASNTGSGVTVSAGGDVVYTDGGAIAAIKAIASNAMSQASDLLAIGLANQSRQSSDNAALAGATVAANSQLAKNVQSGGQTEQNATLLKFAGIVLALVAVVFFFTRKKV